jgi:hypothetical protein
MSKRRVFLSGDRGQQIYEFRSRLVHGDTFNFDFMYEDQNGKVIIAEAKHHRTSVEHVLPRALLIRGSGYAAKPEAPDLAIPDIGQKLLPFILPRKLRAAVAGDLAEDFHTYATQWGRPYALRWLWWELAGLCIRRFGPTAFITAIGVWFRQKFGW